MLIQCPECGRQISSQAAACPHCGCPVRKPTEGTPPRGNTQRQATQAAYKKGPSAFLIFLLIMGVILVPYWLFHGGTGAATGQKTYTEDDYKAAAYTMAEEQVKKHLKAPSTASFCRMSETSFTRDEENTYVMTGWVDAENSYGAKLRSIWGIKVKLDGEKMTMVRLIIDGETVYP